MHRDATDAITRIAVYGEAVSVRMNNSIAIPTMNISHPDRPSLYSMKMNPTYTSAEPVSLWSTMMAIGTRIIRAVITKSRNLLILYPSWLMTVASISDVDILEISAGWNRIGPKPNHDLEPLTSMPRNITATSRPMVTRYIGRENPS